MKFKFTKTLSYLAILSGTALSNLAIACPQLSGNWSLSTCSEMDAESEWEPAPQLLITQSRCKSLSINGVLHKVNFSIDDSQESAASFAHSKTHTVWQNNNSLRVYRGDMVLDKQSKSISTVNYGTTFSRTSIGALQVQYTLGRGETYKKWNCVYNK